MREREEQVFCFSLSFFNEQLFVSLLVVKEYVKTGQLARVFVDIAPVKKIIAICTRKDETLPPVVRKFIRLCMESSKHSNAGE